MDFTTQISERCHTERALRRSRLALLDIVDEEHNTKNTIHDGASVDTRKTLFIRKPLISNTRVDLSLGNGHHEFYSKRFRSL